MRVVHMYYPVTFKLTRYNSVTVYISYNGNIKHPLFGRQSQPIRRHDRDNLKNSYSNGCKPRKLYLEKMQTKSECTIMAGNYDGLDSSPYVLKKSSESKQCGRLDKDVVFSLLLFKDTDCTDLHHKSNIHVFLQTISMELIKLYN